MLSQWIPWRGRHIHASHIPAYTYSPTGRKRVQWRAGYWWRPTSLPCDESRWKCCINNTEGRWWRPQTWRKNILKMRFNMYKNECQLPELTILHIIQLRALCDHSQNEVRNNVKILFGKMNKWNVKINHFFT